jgi:hypothetical protein
MVEFNFKARSEVTTEQYVGPSSSESSISIHFIPNVLRSGTFKSVAGLIESENIQFQPS